MKVLHVIPSISERSGGPGQAILPMCRELREQEVDVLLATTDDGLRTSNGAAGLPRGSVTEYQEFAVILFRTRPGTSFKYSRPFAQWLNSNVSKYELVHIHAVFNHACIAAARACRAQGVPYVIRPLGTLDPWSMQQKSLRKKAFWHALVRRMLSGAAAIHYTSDGEKEAVETSLDLDRGVVVPLGVDLPKRKSAPEQFRDIFPSLSEKKYVLFLSRLLPTKGLDALLDAFLAVVQRPEFQSWRLVLAGEGPEDYVSALKARVGDNVASDFVIFTGWLDAERKDAALQNASLLALPSHHENFGLCVMESLACGVPVLVSPNVNLAPEVRSADAGWISAVDDVAIEDTLLEALASGEERARRGSNGRKLAENYSWRRIAAQLRQMYADIVRDASSARLSATSTKEARGKRV